MFDRAFFDHEIAGLEAQLAQQITLIHRIEGALEVLRQMRDQLDKGAAHPAASMTDALDFDDLDALLPNGHKVDRERGIAPHEN